MGIVLCGASAVDCWRGSDPRTLPSALVMRANRADGVLRECAPSKAELSELVALGVVTGRDGFERGLLVASPDARRGLPRGMFRIWGGGLPAGALCSMSEGLAVCSPEFCLMQLATELGEVRSVQLGFELAGSYSSFPAAEGGMCSREPLSSVRSMTRFLDYAGSSRGGASARAALRYVADGAASPMEAILVMLLCLPLRLGGYGIPLPVLNQRIDLGGEGARSEDARLLSGRHSLVPDLWWEGARLDVEYDSNAFHTGPDQIARDARRRAALTSMGIDCVTVTLG